MGATPLTPCRICARVDAYEQIELDTLMGDPSRWPATVWGMFDPPVGDVPASYRRFGAIEMGREWLTAHGYAEIATSTELRKHYRYDVPKIPANPSDLVATGLIARGNVAQGVETINPLKYIEYYNAGIEVGITGLQLIRDRIEQLRRENKEVPVALIKMAVDAGKQLAMSQASIRAAGRNFGDETDPDDGFRAGSAPAPSPRMGHHRIRRVDGVDRPVADTGPADRDAYNERARQEGGEELPTR